MIAGNEPHLARGERSRWIWAFLDPVKLFRPFVKDALLLDSKSLQGPGFENLFRDAEWAFLRFHMQRLAQITESSEAASRDTIRAHCISMFAGIESRRSLDKSTVYNITVIADKMQRLAPPLRYIQDHYAQIVDITGLARGAP